MRKCAKNAGADNKTPSVPQYFSWINNTNEGATQEQTLVNLEFFKYMQETYGMQIRIYAWDAGNFDGASEGYGNLNSPKFRSQYPEGYKNVVQAAQKLGIRMGLWGSPDGFGDDEKTERERFDFYVHLCKDYHFAEFKIDGVCGCLRPEKAGLYAKMLKECRKYSPDLIVLNHRLDLFEAEKHVTTFLFNGEETYTDVFAHNQITAMHNRAYMFSRGHVKNLARLAEDHGVCLSSSLDYFEDDLIYQAFGRCLILAPEIYGNPWFLRDEELSRLARIYNLHRRYAPILVDGIRLNDAVYGCDAVSRGTTEHRFICTGNNTWESKSVFITLNEEIGISSHEPLVVNLHHPYEQRIGEFHYGDTVEIPLLPFRATLIEVAQKDLSEPMLLNCRYEMKHEQSDGTPISIRMLQWSGGEVTLNQKGKDIPFGNYEAVNCMEKVPLLLGSLTKEESNPAKGEFLYESAVFAADNDSLEARCMKRSGATAIPEVQAARDAFFAQKTYRLRGCEAKNMFDNNPVTFFDGVSKTYAGGMRIDKGCLRIDFREVLSADTLEIEYFAADTVTKEVDPQTVTATGSFSVNKEEWLPACLQSVTAVQNDFKQEVVTYRVHTTYFLPGKIQKAVYQINGKLRYFRLPFPMDRIYAVRLIKNGKELSLSNPRANNLQAYYPFHTVKKAKSALLTLPKEYKTGSFLAIALNGVHGDEQAYCCVTVNGLTEGCPRRAPGYKANVWEHIVCREDKNYTYYYPLPDDAAGSQVEVYALFCDEDKTEIDCRVYLCEKHD